MPVALIAGSTGLVGSHLLSVLLESDLFSRVVAVGRRPPPIRHKKLEFMQTDFDGLKGTDLPPADHVFCCLGTTMKKARSKKQFIRVDLEYAVNLAGAARDAGAEYFYLVSSIGADKHSPFFYTRVKGQLEDAIERIGYKSFCIFRPSLLLGSRHEKRMGERFAGKIMKTLAPLMVGPLAKYRAIKASTVALSMYAAAKNEKGRRVEIFEPQKMRALVKAFEK